MQMTPPLWQNVKRKGYVGELLELQQGLDGVPLFDLCGFDEGLTLADAGELLSAAFRDSQYTLSTVYPLE